MKLKNGSALPIVLAISISVLPLGMSLVNLAGNNNLLLQKEREKIQDLYLAEAAIYSDLYGFYLKDSPSVKRIPMGIWDKTCVDLKSKKLCAIYGIRFEKHFSLNSYHEMLLDFHERIGNLKSQFTPKDTLYGNRRFYSKFKNCIAVENGDVTIKLESNEKRICLFSSGNISFSGDFLVDSLILFAKGNIEISGNGSVNYLEAHAEETIFVSEISFLGNISGKEVHLEKNAFGKFPSVAIAKPRFYGETSQGIHIQTGVRFYGFMWNASSLLQNETFPLNKNIQGNFLGFLNQDSIIEDIPTPAFIGKGKGKFLVWQWL